MPDDISEKISFTASSINQINQINHSTRPNVAREKSKTAPDHRKSSKPIMEKRRRARINNSLCQLKTLILDALKKDTSRHSKLEKADILEMTVKHLKNVQHAQMTATLCTHQPTLGKYRAGFSACITEVTRFMSTSDGASGEFGTQLLAHLASCVSQTNMITCAPPPAVSLAPPQPSDVPFKNGAIITPPENGKLHSGFRVVQTSNGAFALLIPSAPGINFSVQHSSARPAAQCPSVSDSVWRPW